MTSTAEERARFVAAGLLGLPLNSKKATDLIEQALRRAENEKLDEAAKAADETQTFEWRGGDEWAAGYVDGKNAAAERIRSLKKD